MRIDGIEILSDADVGVALWRKFNKASSDLQLSQKAADKYEETLVKDVEFVKKGKKPSTVVGARIYIICLLTGQARGQRNIAWAVGSSEQGIREVYKIMAGRERRNPSVRNKINSNS